MSESMRESCVYCGAEIWYGPGDKLVKCVSCGKVFSVAKFRSEQAKIRAALKAGAEAQAALESAEAAREAAQQRLNAAVDALEGLRQSQEDESAQVAQLLSGMEADRETQAAVTSLLHGLKAGQADQRDALGRMMQSMADGQADADGKLAAMRALSEQILGTQGDIFARLQLQAKLSAQLDALQMDALERQRLASDFGQWCREMQSEDWKRVEAIREGTDALLAGQARLDAQAEALRAAAAQTQQTLEGFREEYREDRLKELEELYRQAEALQRGREFSRAEELYRQVLVKGGGRDAEVCWRMLLCHYCVEYQRDEDGRLVPTILNPDMSDPGELPERQALLESLGPEHDCYRQELKAIDRILNKYRQIQGQVAYDVFISVKQNVNGHTTEDSDRASDLYDHLVEKKLRVFNSRRTQIPAGQEYEPYIISALLSAKLLIVVGSRAEYMDAQWVRNEWSRFQWLQQSEIAQTGKTERVLVCYLTGGMRPEEIPRALNPNHQAIVENVKANEALDGVLAKLFPETGGETAEQAIKQMSAWLISHDYPAVLKKYDELTQSGRFLDRALVHLNALCAKKRVESLDRLIEACGPEILETPEFKTASALAKSPEDVVLISNVRKQVLTRKGPGGDRNPPPPSGGPRRGPAIALALAIVLALAAGGWFGANRLGLTQRRTSTDTAVTPSPTPGTEKAAPAEEGGASEMANPPTATNPPATTNPPETTPPAGPTVGAVSAPQIDIGGFSDAVDGIPYMRDDAVTLDWEASGAVARYVVYVDEPNGQRQKLRSTTDTTVTSRSIPTDRLAPGVYTVRVGAVPVNGTEADAAWGEAKFAIPTATPTAPPVTTVPPTEPPETTSPTTAPPTTAPVTTPPVTNSPTPRPTVGTPTVSVGGFSYRDGGIDYITDSTISLSWSATGEVERYKVYVTEPSGERQNLGTTSDTARTISAGWLEPGVYTVSVGAIPRGGTEYDAVWGEARFGIPAPTTPPTAPPTTVPVTTAPPTQPPAQDIRFYNATIESAVRGQLGKPSDAITEADLNAITALDLRDRGLSEISDLARLRNLTSLNLGKNAIRDLSPLQGLTRLTKLYLGQNSISSASALSGLTGLTELSLGRNSISDPSPLRNLTGLTRLWLNGNSIGSVSALSGMTQLTLLNLDGNSISDLSPLRNMTRMTELRLNKNAVSDLSALSGMRDLATLDLGNNRVSDLSPLRNLTQLTKLYLGNNRISSADALSGLTRLVELSLGRNQLTSVSALRNLRALQVLWINGNDIRDTSPVSFVPDLRLN